MGLKMLERNKEKAKDVLYRVTMECRNRGKTEILESYMQRGKYICKGNGMEMDFCTVGHHVCWVQVEQLS